MEIIHAMASKYIAKSEAKGRATQAYTWMCGCGWRGGFAECGSPDGQTTCPACGEVQLRFDFREGWEVAPQLNAPEPSRAEVAPEPEQMGLPDPTWEDDEPASNSPADLGWDHGPKRLAMRKLTYEPMMPPPPPIESYDDGPDGLSAGPPLDDPSDPGPEYEPEPELEPEPDPDELMEDAPMPEPKKELEETKKTPEPQAELTFIHAVDANGRAGQPLWADDAGKAWLADKLPRELQPTLEGSVARANGEKWMPYSGVRRILVAKGQEATVKAAKWAQNPKVQKGRGYALPVIGFEEAKHLRPISWGARGALTIMCSTKVMKAEIEEALKGHVGLGSRLQVESLK